MGPYKLNIKAYDMPGSPNCMSTCYPETAALTDDEAATKLQAISRGREARLAKRRA